MNTRLDPSVIPPAVRRVLPQLLGEIDLNLVRNVVVSCAGITLFFSQLILHVLDHPSNGVIYALIPLNFHSPTLTYGSLIDVRDGLRLHLGYGLEK